MELNDIKRNTVDLAVVHPETGQETGLVLTLRSPNDPEVRKLAETSIERQRARARRQKPFSVAEEQREAIKINAACVVAIQWGEVTMGGEQPDCAPEVAERLLSRDFILQQVAEQLQIDADFFTASARS